jgi:hypothetical protein
MLFLGAEKRSKLKKAEIERKIRGYSEEKSRIQMRIEYLKPKSC